MKILQVAPSLEKGGAERVIIELSNSLVESGLEVTLLLAFHVDKRLNQNSLDPRVKVEYISEKSRNRFLKYLVTPLWIFKNWGKITKFQVIHCHMTFGLMFGLLIALIRKLRKSYKVVLISTCHSVGTGGYQIIRKLNVAASKYFNFFVLVAIDSYWRRVISTNQDGRFRIIPNGINLPKRVQGRDYFKPSQGFTLGTISRLQAERLPWLFLEVFASVSNLTKNCTRFILAGEGPEREKLVQMSIDLGLENYLSMPGQVQDPSSILEKLDLYVGLNVEETTGIAALEAVLFGLPVVSIQLSDTYKASSSDWIFSSISTKEVARKIVSLMNYPEERFKLQRSQYSFAINEYSVSRMRDSYLRLYSNGASRANER